MEAADLRIGREDEEFGIVRRDGAEVGLVDAGLVDAGLVDVGLVNAGLVDDEAVG